MKKLTFDEFLKEELENDPSLRKEWEDSEQQYQLIRAMIEARNKANLTQAQLAERTGISQANISRIETGNYNPSLNLLRRLAEGMGMKLNITFTPK